MVIPLRSIATGEGHVVFQLRQYTTNNMKNNENIIEEESQPVCPLCLTPFEPLQHYCLKCGGTVGNYTRLIPFINIPFQVEFSVKAWKKFWSDDTGILSKIGLFPIVIVLWGPLFLVGLPFEIWKNLKNNACGYMHSEAAMNEPECSQDFEKPILPLPRGRS